MRVHFARTDCPGFSTIDAFVMIPLNIRTGVVSNMSPVSGSKNALYTHTSLFAYDFTVSRFTSPEGPCISSDTIDRVIEAPAF